MYLAVLAKDTVARSTLHWIEGEAVAGDTTHFLYKLNLKFVLNLIYLNF